MNLKKSDKLEKRLDLIQVNESINILNFKLQILEERQNNQLLNETLDELAKMYTIQKNLMGELSKYGFTFAQKGVIMSTSTQERLEKQCISMKL